MLDQVVNKSFAANPSDSGYLLATPHGMDDGGHGSGSSGGGTGRGTLSLGL